MARIYCLAEGPKIIYIGVTERTLRTRLSGHYGQLREKLKKRIKLSKLQKRLLDLLPAVVRVHLIEECFDADKMEREKYWIAAFKLDGHLLLNQTDGGNGGNTVKYLDDDEVIEMRNKLSESNRGKKVHSQEYIDRLKTERLASGNPAYGTTKHKPVRAVGTKIIIVNPCDIDFMLGNRRGASANVYDSIAKGQKAYGYKWEYVDKNK